MDQFEQYNIGDILFGEYRVLDRFGGAGHSGMGVVYLVEDREHPFPIVLKTFQSDDRNLIDRFRSEARSWVSIGIHTNIVQAFFVREINQRLFIGAEYVPTDDCGRNTITHFLQLGSVSDYLAVRWTAQFCYAMNFAISRGLRAHRDIKPDNLMVDRSGNLKVTDFGLAKDEQIDISLIPQGRYADANTTAAGSFLGTVVYAAPEQILDSSTVDHRADIYSFGIVLYQLINNGAFPYNSRGRTTSEELALMHFVEPVIATDHPLHRIASKCLEKSPKDRYQTYSQLLVDLIEVAGQMGISLPPDHQRTNEDLRELYIKSLSFLELGDRASSLKCIDQYLSQDPDDSSALSLKGRLLFESGQTQEGISWTLRSLEHDPYNSHTLNNLGVFYGTLKETETAIEFLYQAVRVDGYNTGAVMNLACALDTFGSHSAAANMILKALEQAPDKVNVIGNAGNIAASALQNGLLLEAAKVLEKLIDIDPTKVDNLFNLGVCYQSLGRKEEAIELYEAVLRLNPADEEALIFSAQLNAEIGEYEKSLEHCEVMLRNNIAPLKAIAFKAQTLQAMGHGKKAIRFLRNILDGEEHKEDDALWMVLGRIYDKERELAEAKQCYQRSRSILLDRGGSRENIKYLEGEIGRIEFLQDPVLVSLLLEKDE